MKSSLSIRSYTKRMSRHTHSDYHQLVLPLQGNIQIDMDSYVGKVAVGDCIVIPKVVLTVLMPKSHHALLLRI